MLCTGFLWLRGAGFPLAPASGAPPGCGAWAAHRSGFSLRSVAQGEWASEVTAHGLGCSAARGISPDQGLNSRPALADSGFFTPVYATREVPLYFFLTSRLHSQLSLWFSHLAGAWRGLLLPPSPTATSTHTLALRGLFWGAPGCFSPTHWSQTAGPLLLSRTGQQLPQVHMLWALPRLALVPER